LSANRPGHIRQLSDPESFLEMRTGTCGSIGRGKTEKAEECKSPDKTTQQVHRRGERERVRSLGLAAQRQKLLYIWPPGQNEFVG